MGKISLDHMPELRAIKMTWDGDIDHQTIRHTFKQLLMNLEVTEGKIDIVVDIRSSKSFPVATAASESYMLQTHERMGDWLVIGENRTAKKVSKVLGHLQNTSEIIWFEDEAEVLGYLQSDRRP